MVRPVTSMPAAFTTTVHSSVLVADNDRAVSALLLEVVRRLGCGVDAAYDGQEAIALLSSRPYRVLVCDLDMPKATGLEVVQWLSNRAGAPATIVISGFVDAIVERQLLAIPCVRLVMKKPFDLLQFADAVRELLAAEPAPCEGCG